MKKLAYIFPGQGAQYVGMGKDLYENSEAARKLFERCDKILGLALSKICFEGPLEELTRTEMCQPAIVTVSLACLEALKECCQSKGQAGSLGAAFSAGLSLGEYSALVAAGAMSFEDALPLVRKRGQFMQEAGRLSKGSMASVLGLDIEKVRQVCQNCGVFLANLNCPGQVVISGEAQKIKKASQEALEAGALKVIPLRVAGAFHSPLMKTASEKLSRELLKVQINSPEIEVVFNVSAQPSGSAEQIRQNLTRQVSSSVLWEDSVRFMIKSGVSVFLEIGPGKVLKGLIKRIDPSVTIYNVENFQDMATLCQESATNCCF